MIRDPDVRRSAPLLDQGFRSFWSRISKFMLVFRKDSKRILWRFCGISRGYKRCKARFEGLQIFSSPRPQGICDLALCNKLGIRKPYRRVESIEAWNVDRGQRQPPCFWFTRSERTGIFRVARISGFRKSYFAMAAGRGQRDKAYVAAGRVCEA